MSPRRAYIDTPGGQVHLRQSGDASAPALLCLHPIPYSGMFFDSIAPLLADRHRLISPDYPGYGASDPSSKPLSVPGIAESLLAMLRGMGVDTVDVLGFHTGCLVGPEMALQAPEAIRRLVLVDVPCFDAEGREKMRAMTQAPPEFGESVSSIQNQWAMNVSSRLGKVDLDRCLALLAEQLRTGQRANEGFRAAFDYPSLEQLRELTHATRVIGTQSGLLEPSRNAAATIPGADWLELPEVTAPAFETGVDAIAAATLDFLD